jgi:type II secretory pathway component GspD/PulD (secretin)
VPILNFENAPIDLVLMQYATLSEKVLIPAPNLPKVQITLTSNGRELDKEAYLEAIEVALTMNGVVIEPFDKHFLRAFERKSVRTQGIRTLMNVSTNGIPEKGRVISQLIRLNHITAEEAQKAAEGFKDPNGLFQVFERNNAILVTDTQENVNRILEIIKELDVPNPVLEEVFVREIKYALATDIKTYLETIVTESQKDDQKSAATVKSSGGPGFSRPTAAPQPNRLLNLNNRPGLNKPEPTPVTPNAVLTAAADAALMVRGS